MAEPVTPTPPAADGPPKRRGRPRRSDEQRAAHRARLVDVAVAVIRERGPDVSLDEVAEAAGVSKPVLYDAFGSKQGLADAVAVELAGRMEREVFAQLAADPHLDLSRAVRAIVAGLIDLVDAQPEVYAFVARSLRSSDRGLLDNALLRVVHVRGAELVALVVPGLPDEHRAVLTDGLFGFVFTAIESWQSTGRPTKAELVEVLTTVIAASITALAAHGDAWELR